MINETCEAVLASENIISILDPNRLYGDPTMQRYCNEVINKYFSKNDIVMSQNINYFLQTFDVGCGDSISNLNYFPGSYYIHEREAHSSDDSFALTYHNCPTNDNIPHPALSQTVKIPIKRKNIKSIIDKYTEKIDLNKLESIIDICNICIQENQKCYKLCCGKLCKSCINDKSYKMCIICREEIIYKSC